MKHFVAVLMLIAAGNTLDQELLKELKDLVIEKTQECIRELHASKEDITQLLHSETPTSHVGKCVFSCVQKAYGIQDQDGKLNSEATMGLVEQIKEIDEHMYDAIKPIVKDCLAKSETNTETDDCIVAVTVSMCFKEGYLAAGFSGDIFSV